MDPGAVVDLARYALWMTVLVAGPLLLVGLAVGLVIGMLQAATSINEMTLSFVPKLIIVAIVLMTGGPWLLRQITGFTLRLYENVPYLIG